MNRSPSSRLAPRFLARSACLWLAAAQFAATATPARAREAKALSQFYLVNDPTSVDSLKRNFARMSLVCPQWLEVTEAGELESTVDSSVVDWAAASGVLLMPILANRNFQPAVAHSILGDAAIQSKVIEKVIELSRTDHFFGIQFDFENIIEQDRDSYTKFVHDASKQFRKNGLKVSVAVVPPLAPPPAVSPLAPPPTTGWISNPRSAAYDYHHLADGALFVSLMTYDEFSSPEESGPVAGAPWMEACLAKLLESVPAKKVLLGIPLYYREWSGKSVREGSIQTAVALAAKWNAPIEFDPEQKEAFFIFNDGTERHRVWLLDSASLRERLEMVARYHLQGFCAWRLGFEDPKSWDTVFSESPEKIH